MDTATFTLDELIIHEITRRQLAPPRDSELFLSDVASPLDDDLTAYFEDRIIENLRLGAFPVVTDMELYSDPSKRSPVPDLVFEHLTGAASDFVETSKALGRHLFASQTGVNSPGLLIVIRGAVEVGQCLALLKLQKQEGVRLERTGPQGSETFSVEHLRQLMLTNETRVFKVALFDADNLAAVEDVHGVVADKQRAFRPEKQIADFFLSTFLGCRLRDDPAQTTSRHFAITEQFINREVAEPEKQVRYHRALLADLTSQSPVVDPRSFAHQYLDPSDQPRYLAHLRNSDAQTAAFDKEPGLIATKLREEEYVLESGIRIRGSAEALEEHAELDQQEDNTLEMLIRDRLKRVNGR